MVMSHECTHACTFPRSEHQSRVSSVSRWVSCLSLSLSFFPGLHPHWFSTALASILYNGPFILLSVACSCLIKPSESLSVKSQNGRHWGAACPELGVGFFWWSCVHVYSSKHAFTSDAVSKQPTFFFIDVNHTDKYLFWWFCGSACVSSQPVATHTSYTEYLPLLTNVNCGFKTTCPACPLL